MKLHEYDSFQCTPTLLESSSKRWRYSSSRILRSSSTINPSLTVSNGLGQSTDGVTAMICKQVFLWELSFRASAMGALEYPYSRRPLFRLELSPSRGPRPLCLGRSPWTWLSPPVFPLLPSPPAGERDAGERERPPVAVLPGDDGSTRLPPRQRWIHAPSSPATTDPGAVLPGDDGSTRLPPGRRRIHAPSSPTTTDPCTTRRRDGDEQIRRQSSGSGGGPPHRLRSRRRRERGREGE